jgi:probable LLM family oxidoreductase
MAACSSSDTGSSLPPEPGEPRNTLSGQGARTTHPGAPARVEHGQGRADLPGVEIGLYSFGERTPLGGKGPLPEPATRMKGLVAEAVAAEVAGLDVFGVGEHHRPDYLVSSPATVLAAAASRTSRIRLTSAVTVLGSEDPVRVFQAFSTLDLLSDGRAEIMAGRGSFTESFPIFGQELSEYDEIFAEKLDLLLRLRKEPRLHWTGRHRPPLRGESIHPRPLQDPLPVWLAVGGTPASAVRSGTLGLPMALAIIGGAPPRFRPMVELYRQAWRAAGHPGPAPLGINGHGFLAETAESARETAWPTYLDTMGRIGRERGWPPPTRARFELECGPDGPLLVGSPDEVAEKLLRQYHLFGWTRYLMQLTVGSLPPERVLHAIHLLGTVVAPKVREALAAIRSPA